MDDELKDMLMKLLEGQNRLETKVSLLESVVKKSSFKLENIEKNIDLIAEMQKPHKE